MKKWTIVTAAWMSSIANLSAETIVVRARVNGESSVNIFDTYIKNSSMPTPYTPPSHYYVTLGMVRHIKDEDIGALKSYIETWMSKQPSLKGLKVTLGRAKYMGREVVILVDYPLNELNNFSYATQKQLTQFVAPSGSKYSLTPDRTHQFEPLIVVGESYKDAAQDPVDVINRRLLNNDLIKRCSLVGHSVDAVTLDTMPDPAPVPQTVDKSADQKTDCTPKV